MSRFDVIKSGNMDETPVDPRCWLMQEIDSDG
jgi:hypothetical protein